MAEWLAVFFHGKSTALCELQFESVKWLVSASNFILRGPRFEYRWRLCSLLHVFYYCKSLNVTTSGRNCNTIFDVLTSKMPNADRSKHAFVYV